MFERELGDLDCLEAVRVAIYIDVANAVNEVTNLVGLREVQLDSLASHAENTYCALWVLAGLRLRNDSGCVLLTIPT